LIWEYFEQGAQYHALSDELEAKSFKDGFDSSNIKDLLGVGACIERKLDLGMAKHTFYIDTPLQRCALGFEGHGRGQD
jgi:hypothetical protein